MSKITLDYNGKEYTLEYSRQSVKTMESQGFVYDQLFTKPVTMIPTLFNGAFIKNHRGTKRDVMDAIYDEIPDKSGILQALLEMYAETLSTLTEDKDAEGNVSWTLVK